MITVFGAKGGIGKTTIATNLATALVQKTNQSVVLVDLDTRFGDVGDPHGHPGRAQHRGPGHSRRKRSPANWCRNAYTSTTAACYILPAPIRPTDWRNVHAGHIERIVNRL